MFSLLPRYSASARPSGMADSSAFTLSTSAESLNPITVDKVVAETVDKAVTRGPHLEVLGDLKSFCRSH
jgi:hypothetical protein